MNLTEKYEFYFWQQKNKIINRLFKKTVYKKKKNGFHKKIIISL